MQTRPDESLIVLMAGAPTPPPPKFAYRLRLHRSSSNGSLASYRPGSIEFAHEQDGKPVLTTLLTRDKALKLADELRRFARQL
jgi:hypothetical protein